MECILVFVLILVAHSSGRIIEGDIFIPDVLDAGITTKEDRFAHLLIKTSAI